MYSEFAQNKAADEERLRIRYNAQKADLEMKRGGALAQLANDVEYYDESEKVKINSAYDTAHKESDAAYAQGLVDLNIHYAAIHYIIRVKRSRLWRQRDVDVAAIWKNFEDQKSEIIESGTRLIGTWPTFWEKSKKKSVTFGMIFERSCGSLIKLDCMSLKGRSWPNIGDGVADFTQASLKVAQASATVLADHKKAKN